VVGCAPAYSRRPGNSSSSYLVQHRGTSVLLDLGQGSFAELWRHGSFADISAVAISHNHADHNIDLIPLRHWVKYQNRGYGPALYSPTDLRRRLGGFHSEPEFMADFRGEALKRGSFLVGDLRIEVASVTHIPDSFAFRVSDPAAPDRPGLVYSGDCGRANDLLPLIRRGDVLLSEAAFGGEGADPSGVHLTAGEAARVADESGTERLILTHILDRYDRAEVMTVAEQRLPGRVQIAEPGLAVDIG
jgi:ribonuclease BN (tRNA processing enzyme)